MGTSTNELRSAEIIRGIEEIGPEFIIEIPSSTLKEILNHFEQHEGVHTFPVTREEEGIGIAAGLALADAKVVMVIQDNGIGNMLTALTTFPQAYHIPLLAIVSVRGGLNEYNSMIHTFCEYVPDILKASNVRYFTLDERVPIERWRPTIVEAYQYCQVTHRPVLVLCNLMGA
ncbi:MAG: thiamine pyrophosphate-binding protein [Chloroflexi bacterium]|nr:thiamine pyrophosphate-binding protein [Chloroflexota bacterium]